MRKDILDLSEEIQEEIKEVTKKIDEDAMFNSMKVIEAFQRNHVSDMHFNFTTGYGYNDVGRDCIEKIFAEVLGAEDSLVRNQFISGTHALTVALFALLRPGDTMLAISGKPYDTLDEVIGITENASSLKSFGVKYKQIDLIENDFDVENIVKTLQNEKIKLVHIQRSKGYSTRESISVDKIEEIVKEIRKIDSEVIVFVDNCYCEFVERKTPLEVGADVIVGSLIKNLGGGIANNGAYVAGKEKYVSLAAERLTSPGQGKEVGPTLGANRSFLQGLYMAPSVVASSLKTAVFASRFLEKLGYKVSPKYDEKRADIVQTIEFGDAEKLIKFCQGIQMGSAIDSDALPEPSDMPGYADKIIMASGSFTQGSSIELSCDGPIRPPYIAFLQGSLTYEYGKYGVLKASYFLMV